jgi:hypothetical protein
LHARREVLHETNNSILLLGGIKNMANFKKGIALALVATTAFTFAPVSTLGVPNAVVAEAAVTTVTDDIKLGLGTTDNKSTDLTDGSVYTVSADTLFEGLTITATNTENAQNVNVLNTGKKFTADTATLNITAVPTAKTGQTTTLTITKYSDATDTATVVATTTYKITAANLSGVKLYSSAANAQSAVALPSSVTAGSAITAVSFESIDPAGAPTGAAQDLVAGSLSLKSSNDSIATVTQNANAGYDIKGVSVGTTTVYVYDETNKKVLGNFEIKVTQGGTQSLGDTVDAKKGEYAHFVADTTKANKLTNITANSADVTMDPISDNQLQLVYGGTKYSAFTYYSENSTVATVDGNGVVTAVKSSATPVRIHVIGQANANYVASTDFIVNVTVKAGTDKITVKNGEVAVNNVNLDLANSTAPNAVKSAQLIATSVTGAPVKWTVSDANGNAAASSAISVSDTGLVTSLGNVPTTAYVTAYTEKTETVPATKTTIAVNIYALPEADFDVPATVALNYADKTSENVKVAYDGTLNISIAKDVDSNAGAAVTNFVTNGKNDWTIKLANTASKTLGTDVVTVTAPEVAGKTRMTTKTFKVVVTENAVAKKASDLTVESTSVVAKVGETATIGAKATNEVTYTSADESVATVSADGVVTAVKAGQTVVTVKAAESDTMEAATITVPVVVTEAPVVIAKPAKVKSVKAVAVKGGKVKFSFAKVSKAAGYQVVYTVGKKTVKKTTTKTALTVKIGKGKKATVKVRAYNYKNGTTKQYGAFSAKKSVKASK